jgi:hypothetical protein
MTTACFGGSKGDPVEFRVLREGTNVAQYCAESRAFFVGHTGSQWRENYSRAVGCRGFDAHFTTPELAPGEAGVAARWRSGVCSETTVRTISVRLRDGVMTVLGKAGVPSGCRADGSVALQSFLGVHAPDLGRTTTIRFMLDGREIGRTNVPPL